MRIGTLLNVFPVLIALISIAFTFLGILQPHLAWLRYLILGFLFLGFCSVYVAKWSVVKSNRSSATDFSEMTSGYRILYFSGHGLMICVCLFVIYWIHDARTSTAEYFQRNNYTCLETNLLGVCERHCTAPVRYHDGHIICPHSCFPGGCS